VDAVLDASGQSGGRRRTGPAGLTPREIKVLTLIARGASTRQVAHRLSITTNTAETHIEIAGDHSLFLGRRELADLLDRLTRA
jgi:DNA-binding NarL/FixJ family response regulator